MNKKILLIQLSLIILFISSWQYLSDHNIINTFIFSSPINIIKCISNLYVNNNLFNHIFITLKEIFISFILCFIISFFISLLLYIFNSLYKVVDLFLNIFNSLPKVSLGPIIIIICGANTNSIIVMSLLISTLVCIQTLYSGFINTDEYLLTLFKTYKANKIQTIFNLVIPSSYKSIIISLKLNLSMTLVGVIMGEFLISKGGIGYLIIYGTQIFNLDLVYSGLTLLIILSYLIYIPINILENKNKN